MRIYKYFAIIFFIISCSPNKGVYWCGDHACANNKEKESYFKKTMIVEVRNSDNDNGKILSTNEIILNQSESAEKKTIINDEKFNQKIKNEEKQMEENEKLIEKLIELQEEKRANLEREIKAENQKLSMEKKEQLTSSSFAKVLEIKEIKSKNFEEIVEKILIRNSSRSYPKINDIPK